MSLQRIPPENKLTPAKRSRPRTAMGLPFLGYLWSYLTVVYDNWLSLVSGIASTVLLFLLAFWGDEWAFLRDNKKTFIWITIICLLVTGFSVWYRERRELVKEQERNQLPDIRGRIEEDFIYVSTTKRGVPVTYIPIVISLVNYMSEASVERFELIVIAEGKEYKTQNLPTESLELTRPSYDEFGLPTNPGGVKEAYKDLLKHRHEPLKRGIPQHGGFSLFSKTSS